MENQFENDREAVLEHVSSAEMNPVIGMTFPLHKNILMNMVFDKGAIPKVVAVEPKTTLTMETRILVKPDGTEIDMFREQNLMTPAIDASAPLVDIGFTLPEVEGTNVVEDELDGTSVDNLSIDTFICAVQIKDVYIDEGDVLPNTDGYIIPGGTVATAETKGNKDVWYRVNMQFAPGYGEYDRTLMSPVSIAHKKNTGTELAPVIETVVTKDMISASMHKNRFNISSISAKINAVRVRARLDTSNGMIKACSVKWQSKSRIVEIGPAIPINTTISPDEVKDIGALYNVNQLTKVMSLFKSVMGNYKDDKIHQNLNESYARLDDSQKAYNTFDFAVREGYMLDHVEWRHKTFMDFFDSHVTKLLQVLNDPNMTITVFGDPDIVKKISPTEYTYQTPSSIGPVELDFVKTVTTSDKRVYQFIGSDKLRGNTELIVVLCPRNTDRVIYRIYDYQLYVSNEIRNSVNPTLPAIHAFERWKFVEYQPVQGRVKILNPTGLIPTTKHV
jgi:hypothetical protein